MEEQDIKKKQIEEQEDLDIFEDPDAEPEDQEE